MAIYCVRRPDMISGLSDCHGDTKDVLWNAPVLVVAMVEFKAGAVK